MWQIQLDLFWFELTCVPSDSINLQECVKYYRKEKNSTARASPHESWRQSANGKLAEECTFHVKCVHFVYLRSLSLLFMRHGLFLRVAISFFFSSTSSFREAISPSDRESSSPDSPEEEELSQERAVTKCQGSSQGQSCVNQSRVLVEVASYTVPHYHGTNSEGLWTCHIMLKSIWKTNRKYKKRTEREIRRQEGVYSMQVKWQTS